MMLQRNLFRRLCFSGCPKLVWWLQHSPVPRKQGLERKGLDPYLCGRIFIQEAFQIWVPLIPGEWRMTTWCLTLGCLPRPGWHLRGLAASGKTHTIVCIGWTPLSVGYQIRAHGTIWITMRVSFRELDVSSKRFDTTWMSWMCCQKLHVDMCMPKMNGLGKMGFSDLWRGGVHTFVGLHFAGGCNSLGSSKRTQDWSHPQDTAHSGVRRRSRVAAVWAEDASQRADGSYGAPPGLEEWWDPPTWGASPIGGKRCLKSARLCRKDMSMSDQVTSPTGGRWDLGTTLSCQARMGLTLRQWSGMRSGLWKRSLMSRSSKVRRWCAIALCQGSVMEMCWQLQFGTHHRLLLLGGIPTLLVVDQVWGVCCWQPVAAGWCRQSLSRSSKRPLYPTSRHCAPLLTGMDSSSPWLKTCWMIVCSLGFATGVNVMMIGLVSLLDLECWDLRRGPTSVWVSACRRVLLRQARRRPPWFRSVWAKMATSRLPCNSRQWAPLSNWTLW